MCDLPDCSSRSASDLPGLRKEDISSLHLQSPPPYPSPQLHLHLYNFSLVLHISTSSLGASFRNSATVRMSITDFTTDGAFTKFIYENNKVLVIFIEKDTENEASLEELAKAFSKHVKFMKVRQTRRL